MKAKRALTSHAFTWTAEKAAQHILNQIPDHSQVNDTQLQQAFSMVPGSIREKTQELVLASLTGAQVKEDLGALIDQAAFKFFAQQLADGVPYEETVYGKTDAALEKIRSGAISTKEAMAVLDSNAKLADCYWQHLEAQDPRASDTLCQRCWKWLSWEEVQAKG